ncbi:MAG TPA: ABC transporter permease [Actinomycetes bacterium]|nr:ABC transporter permease [Actinomycetes bacterium]
MGVAGVAAAAGEWRTPGHIGQTVAAFVRRDWAIARSYRLNLVLEVGSIAFTLGMFFFLGRLVDGAGAGRMDQALAHGYFAFAAVGQAVLRVVQVGTSSIASRLRTEQTTGTLETLLTSAAPTSLVILATGAFDLLFAVASGVVTLALAALLGMHLGATPASATAVLLVGLPAMVALFAALGVAVAAFVMVFKQGAALVGLTTSVLALLCGVFFPVGTLPRPLGSIAELLPLTWVLDVLRAGLLDGRVDWAHLGLLLGSAALLLPASLLLFQAATRVARRRGTLAQY